MGENSQVPPVPDYWHWAPLKLHSNGNACAFRESLFANVQEHDVHIEKVKPWHYNFETVTPRYVEAECHFFRLDGTTYADINLLQGDRFTWNALSRHMSNKSSAYSYKRSAAKPIRADKRLEALVEPCMDEDMFDLVGSDFNPGKLLPLLVDASPNIKRCAMRALYHCDTPFDVSFIEPYCHRDASFLDRRIQYWANKIVQRRVVAARL